MGVGAQVQGMRFNRLDVIDKFDQVSLKIPLNEKSNTDISLNRSLATHQDLPRKEYHEQEQRRLSEEEKKRRAMEAKAVAKKNKGGSIFRKYD